MIVTMPRECDTEARPLAAGEEDRREYFTVDEVVPIVPSWKCTAQGDVKEYSSVN